MPIRSVITSRRFGSQCSWFTFPPIFCAPVFSIYPLLSQFCHQRNYYYSSFSSYIRRQTCLHSWPADIITHFFISCLLGELSKTQRFAVNLLGICLSVVENPIIICIFTFNNLSILWSHKFLAAGILYFFYRCSSVLFFPPCHAFVSCLCSQSCNSNLTLILAQIPCWSGCVAKVT